jgi:hypothetical protein
MGICGKNVQGVLLDMVVALYQEPRNGRDMDDNFLCRPAIWESQGTVVLSELKQPKGHCSYGGQHIRREELGLLCNPTTCARPPFLHQELTETRFKTHVLPSRVDLQFLAQRQLA